MAIHQELIPDARSVATRLAQRALKEVQSVKTSTNGTVSVSNEDGTRTIIGTGAGLDPTGQKNGIAAFVGDTEAPGVPTGITAVSVSGVTALRWDGTLDGGIPADFDHITFYIGGIKAGELTKAGSITLKVTEGETYEVYATSQDQARNEAGELAPNVSAHSATVEVTGSTPAEAVTQYVWTDEDGLHISPTGEHDLSAANLLLTSTLIALREAAENIISMDSSGTPTIALGGETSQITLCGGQGQIGMVANFLALFADRVALRGNQEAMVVGTDVARVDASSASTNGVGFVAEAEENDGDAVATTYATKGSHGASVQVVADDTSGHVEIEGDWVQSVGNTLNLLGLTASRLGLKDSGDAGIGIVKDGLGSKGYYSAGKHEFWGLFKIRGVDDTSWSWTVGPDPDGHGVRYRVATGVCYVVADLVSGLGKTVTGSGVSLGTIPAGIRPVADLVTAGTGKSNNLGQMTIRAGGSIDAYLFGGQSEYFGAFASYPVA